MDIALKKMELMEVMNVLIKYDIILKKESKEYMDTYCEMMSGWRKENEGSVVVNVVATRESRCFACYLGKRMTVYQFQHKHS
jgi:hypothetical protein